MAASIGIEYLSTFPSSFDKEGYKPKYRLTKKTGYLTKRPRWRNHKLGRWRKRWFVLVGSIVSKPGKMPERYVWLEYFKVPGKHRWSSKQQPPILKGMLDLRCCIGVNAIDGPFKGYDYVFNVITKTEIHCFSAESEQDRQDWITALNDFLFPKDVYCTWLPTERNGAQTVILPSPYLNCIMNASCHPESVSLPRTDGSGNIVQGGEAEGVEKQRMKLRLNNSISVLDDVHKPSSSHRDSRWLPYEEPQESEYGLHIQLAGFGVRNMSRHQIKADAPVPSHGKFLCYKGRLTMTSSGKAKTDGVFLKTPKDETSTTLILQEAAILAQLYHPNVVKLFGTVLVGYPKMTIMELCSKGNLKNRLLSLKTEVDDTGCRYYTTILDYCHQITLGMHYLSERGFIHKSLMAEHVLVTEDDSCKISGFADSVALENSKTPLTESSLAISKWTAPEVLSGGNYSIASTVWSLGIVLHEIWSLGSEPYALLSGYTTVEILEKLNAGYRLHAPHGCPEAIYDLMKRCWQKEPMLRPSYTYLIEYLLKHEKYLSDLELLNADSAHSKRETKLGQRNAISPTQHTTSALPVQRNPYYNYPLSFTSSKPPSTTSSDITPRQLHLPPKFLKSESVPAPASTEDNSDEDDYTTEVSTILEIRSKSTTSLDNRYDLITLPLSTTISAKGRWTYFFDDSNDESGPEDSECDSPYQNECQSFLVSTETSNCSSTETMHTQNETETSHHIVPQMTKAKTPTFTAHNNVSPKDEQWDRGKRGAECMVVGLAPSLPSFSRSGLQLHSEREMVPSSANVATMKQKTMKPPVPTPRSKCRKLRNSLPTYYNYNPHAQWNKLHRSTPSIAVQGDTSPSPNEYETIKGCGPEIWDLLENRTVTQISLDNSCPSDGYELIQRYETLTHPMTMEEFSYLAHHQKPRSKWCGEYLSL